MGGHGSGRSAAGIWGADKEGSPLRHRYCSQSVGIDKADYARVLAGGREALQRFADGTVLVWVPQLQLVESAQLPQRLAAAADTLAPRGWLHARKVLYIEALKASTDTPAAVNTNPAFKYPGAPDNK